MKDQEKIIQELIKRETDEGTNAYAAFLFWAMLPQSERSDGKEAVKKTAEYAALEPSTITQYRVAYRWDERTNLIDAHFFTLQFEDRRRSMHEQNKKFAAETKEIQIKAFRISNKALDLVEDLLNKAPLSNEVRETGYVKALQEDGSHKVVPTTTTIIMKAEVKDISPLLRAAVEVPSKVLGLPTEIVQPDVVPPVADIGQMSDDDIAETRRKIAEKKRELQKTQNIPGVQ